MSGSRPPAIVMHPEDPKAQAAISRAEVNLLVHSPMFQLEIIEDLSSLLIVVVLINQTFLKKLAERGQSIRDALCALAW